MKPTELLKQGSAILDRANIDNSRREAEFILSYILQNETADLYVSDSLSDGHLQKFMEMIDRRCNGEPLQLILGEWDFYNLKLDLKKGVFIPRPETEGLVELVLNLINPANFYKGMEIGIGSGAISLALLKKIVNLNMVATDISRKALNLTAINAKKNNLGSRLNLILTDVFSGIQGKFDFIISNPPYILSSEIHRLPTEVRYDPIEALDGGNDGLSIVREIACGAESVLKPGGFIALEIHEEMVESTSGLFQANFEVCVEKDLNQKNRYLIAFYRR